MTTAAQTIHVRDNAPPVITTPPDVTLECPADTRPEVTGFDTAQDATGPVGEINKVSVTPENGGHLWGITRVIPGTEGWAPGDYAVEVSAPDPQSNTVLSRTVRFKVRS